MILRTERLILRPWREQDLIDYAELAGDPVAMAPYPATLSRSEAREMIEQLQAIAASDGFCYSPIERAADGAFLGVAGLARCADFVEIGWIIAPAFRGKGYASETATAWLRHGFETLRLAEILAFALDGAAASERLLARLGFAPDPSRDPEHPEGRRAFALTREGFRARCSKPAA